MTRLTETFVRDSVRASAATRKHLATLLIVLAAIGIYYGVGGPGTMHPIPQVGDSVSIFRLATCEVGSGVVTSAGKGFSREVHIQIKHHKPIPTTIEALPFTFIPDSEGELAWYAMSDDGLYSPVDWSPLFAHGFTKPTTPRFEHVLVLGNPYEFFETHPVELKAFDFFCAGSPVNDNGSRYHWRGQKAEGP